MANKTIIRDVDAHDWQIPIYKVLGGANSESVCSAYCGLELDTLCHMYVYDSNAQECLLGNFLINNGTTSAEFGSSDVIVFPGELKKESNSLAPHFIKIPIQGHYTKGKVEGPWPFVLLSLRPGFWFGVITSFEFQP